MRRLPLTPKLSAELTMLFRRELELCNLKAGETLLIFSDSMFNPHYVAACIGAAMLLGAEPIHMEVPHSTASLSSRTIVEAWKAADMVIPLTTHIRWLYSEAHNEALDSGTRTLMVQEPVDILRRLKLCEFAQRQARIWFWTRLGVLALGSTVFPMCLGAGITGPQDWSLAPP
jgi:2,5-dihydroxypyridine 5,6-dioxygenase